MINETINGTLNINASGNLSLSDLVITSGEKLYVGDLIFKEVQLPFYKWYFCLGGNCLRFWVIGSIILFLITFGIVMYKLGKKRNVKLGKDAQ